MNRQCPQYTSGALSASALHPTPCGHAIDEELDTYQDTMAQGTWREQVTPEPPEWSDLTSCGSDDTDTHFGSSDSASDTLSELDTPGHPSIRPDFWPNRGSRKTKAAIAEEVRKDVIHRLPPSADHRLPRFGDMSKADVGLRVQELWGYTAKSIQVDTIWEVGCQQKSRILVAKTGVGKSLMFETIPLLDPDRPGIALVVMPLKHIQHQQLEKINSVSGAAAAVYDGSQHSQLLRYQIAAGHFTHG